MTGASGYDLYVLDQAPKQTPLFLQSLTGTSEQFTASQALTPGHTYTWYSGAISASGAIAWSGPQNFSIAALTAPTQVSPINKQILTAAAGYDTPTFSWNPVPDAAYYSLFVADNLTPTKAFLSSTSISGTSFTASAGLTPGHSYTWYIGAVSTNGVAIGWSGPQSFSLAPLTGTPTPLTPNSAIAAGPGFDAPTFTWNGVAAAGQYYLYVFDTTTNKPVINNPNVVGTSFVASTGLTPGHSFQWYIAAESTNNAVVNFNPTPASFSLAPLPTNTNGSAIVPTPAAPNSPTSIAAAPGFDTPTFTWTSVPDAGHYYLYVLDTTTHQPVINNPNIVGTSFAASTGLTPGHSFQWYIAAESTNNAVVNFNPTPGSFSLAPLIGTPTPLTPNSATPIAAGPGFDTPTFNWNGVANAAHYYLYVLDMTTHQPVINNPNVVGTSFVANTALTPGHSFQWYIAAESTNNAIVNFNPTPGSFSLAPLPGAPTQLVPIVPGQSTSLTFTWSAVLGANHYYLYLLDTTTNPAQPVQADISSTVFATTFAASGLTHGHSYTWYVGAVSANGSDIAWSGPASFTAT